MHRSKLRAGLRLMLLAVCCGRSGTAQFASTIQGLVHDPSGAVVAGATVRLSSHDSGVERITDTDLYGFYRFPALAAGRYELTARSDGFQIVSFEVPLGTAQTVEVNVTLSLLTLAISESVVTTPSLLASQDAVTGQQLDRSFIARLPLLNRTLFDLVYLAPGVTAPAGGGGQSNNFVSNGSRNATADVLLDGVSTVNYEQNSGVQLPLYTPPVEAVEEFKLQQSSFSAEIGFSGATVVRLVTRSGSNEFHGSAYEFLRNNRLDANGFFSNRAGIGLPALRRNQFGASAGGPIRRSKTFFFADYEGTRTRSMATRNAGVPSFAERNGDFGELCAAKGGSFSAAGRCSASAGQLWDPYSGSYQAQWGGPRRTVFIPFNDLARYVSPGSSQLAGTGFQLPPRAGNLIDPVSAKLMALYPLPNMASGTAAYNPYNNWIGSGVDQNLNDQLDVKIDHRFATDQLSGKLAFARNHYQSANLFGNYGDVNTQGPGVGGSRMLALNHTHVWGGGTLLMTALGITRELAWTRGIAAGFPDFDPVKSLGMPAYIARSAITAPPSIRIYGGYASVNGGASVGAQPWSYMRYGQETAHLISTLGRTRGRNELRIGGEMRIHDINFLQAGTPAGLFLFDANSTSELPSSGGGDAMAGFLMGVAAPNWGQYEIPVAVSTRSRQYAAFIQDNWRVTDKLTLNVGLRYDLDLPRTERHNRMSWVDPAAASPVAAPGMGGLRGGLRFADAHTRSPYDPHWNNIGPRSGVAYQATSRTVLQGGYGVFYSLSKGGAAGTGAGGFQGFSQTTPWDVTYQNDGATTFGRLSDPFPNGILPPPGSSLGLLTGIGSGISGPIRNWNTSPYEQTWSLGFQRVLPLGMLADASYIGKKGTHLYFGGAGNLDVLPESAAGRFSSDPAYMNAMAPNPFHGLPGYQVGRLSGPSVPRWQLMLPFPQFASVAGNDPPWANSIYQAFQLRIEKRFSQGLQFLVTYTDSKSIDNASVAGSNVGWLGGFVSLQDPNNLRLERSLSQFDIPQVLQTGYVYELPMGRGKRFGGDWGGTLNAILGGWQTNGIWRFSSGMPLGLTLEGGQAIPTYGSQRPNLSAALRRSPVFSLDRYFVNPEAALKPAAYQLGNAPRTLPNLRAPGIAESSLSLFKQFAAGFLGERTRIEYRIEAFNALNHPRFAAPDGVVGHATFGQISQQANAPREIQMGLRAYW